MAATNLAPTSRYTAHVELADAVSVNAGPFIQKNDLPGFIGQCAQCLVGIDPQPAADADIEEIEKRIREEQSEIDRLKFRRGQFPIFKKIAVKAKNQTPKKWYTLIDGGIYTALGVVALFLPMALVNALLVEIDMEFFRNKGEAASLISILAAAGAIAVSALRETFQCDAQTRYDRAVFIATIASFVSFLWIASSVALNGGGSLIGGGGLNEGNVIFSAGVLDFLAGGTLYIAKVRMFGPQYDTDYVQGPAAKVFNSIIQNNEQTKEALIRQRSEMLAENDAWRGRHALALSLLAERFELKRARYQAAESAAMLEILEGRT